MKLGLQGCPRDRREAHAVYAQAISSLLVEYQRELHARHTGTSVQWIQYLLPFAQLALAGEEVVQRVDDALAEVPA